MYGYAVWCKCFHFIQCVFYHYLIFSRQTNNQIHIDVVKTTLSCKHKCLLCFLYCMTSSNNIQRFLIHRLWIYRNPCNRIIADHHQLFSGNTVRSSCFNRKFCKILAAKILHQCIQKDFQLLRFQRCRCTSSNINRIQFSAFCFHDCSNFFYLFAKCFQILVHTVLPLFQWIGTERTVKTYTRAERDSHIQTVTIFIINIFENLSFSVRYCDRKCCFLRTHHIALSHFLCRFRILHTKFNQSHCKFRRPDTCQVSPRKCFPRQLY